MVSRVLVQGAKENVHPVTVCATPVTASPTPRVQGSTASIGSLFNNCTVTISPQNFIINNNVSSAPPKLEDCDVQELLKGIDLDDFFRQ